MRLLHRAASAPVIGLSSTLAHIYMMVLAYGEEGQRESRPKSSNQQTATGVQPAAQAYLYSWDRLLFTWYNELGSTSVYLVQ